MHNVEQKKGDKIESHQRRRFPVGAELLTEGGANFRVWAPGHKKIEVVIGSGNSKSGGRFKSYTLEEDSTGYFSGVVEEAEAGTLYRFKIDNNDYLYPDPVSRFQPEGPHGPSAVVDPNKFQWTDQSWKGIQGENQVIYEMHIGTFTPEGTLHSAMKQLSELASIGITIVELMPIAEFPGKYGWGYDGVDLFAPTRLYGNPDDYRLFIDQAHSLGLGVILDVVYNHLGPDGNYLMAFTEDYFTDKYKNEWGEAINFDGENSHGVREFFKMNAAYWIDEYHFDGLRLDATQQIFDSSKNHILKEITQSVRSSGKERRKYIVAENEPQHVKLVKPIEEGGYGMDGLWNDDFHHTAMVALTGHSEAYYSDYKGSPQEFISSFKWGYLYQGQYYSWQKQRRGTPSFRLKPQNFVTFIQNHDQIANSARGQRCHQISSPGKFRAMTTLLLLAPGTPMFFQGQEFAANTPFFYFADHKKDLAELVCKGRAEFLSQFPSLASKAMQACLPDPSDPETFRRSKLNLADRQNNADIYQMTKDLLKLRREDPVLSRHRPRMTDGAVLTDAAFLLRFFAEDAMDRLLIVNFGIDLKLDPAPEPLLAPPFGMQWDIKFSSENPAYGANGYPELDKDGKWFLQGFSASLLIPKPLEHRENSND